jgi:hypothetical protein
MLVSKVWKWIPIEACGIRENIEQGKTGLKLLYIPKRQH